jgi:hypothetical protein
VATGLVQPGSRIRYRLQIAGAADRVQAYRDWASSCPLVRTSRRALMVCSRRCICSSTKATRPRRARDSCARNSATKRCG